MPGRRLKPNEGDRFLAQAGLRQARMELRCRLADGEYVIFRSRILDVDEKYIYLDPPGGSAAEAIRSGAPVDGHLYLRDARYGFTSEIVDEVCLVQLNLRKQIVGMTIRRPVELIEAQRREHFRLSLSAGDVVASLHAATPEGICPVHARPRDGVLLNLSVGGAGVRMDGLDVTSVRNDAHLFMTFHLPDEPEPFVFLASVRQSRNAPEAAAVRLGLRFEPWPDDRAFQREQQRLQRYITRKQLERLRRAG